MSTPRVRAYALQAARTRRAAARARRRAASRNPPQLGRPLAFSSPDTPGMPPPSRADGLGLHAARTGRGDATAAGARPRASSRSRSSSTRGSASSRREMHRVAEREPHLTPEQVRDEVAAGRMVIPANKVHLGYKLDPMASAARARPRSTPTWAPRRSRRGTDEEVEKLHWAERWGADTVMDLSTGGDLDAMPRGDHRATHACRSAPCRSTR